MNLTPLWFLPGYDTAPPAPHGLFAAAISVYMKPGPKARGGRYIAMWACQRCRIRRALPSPALFFYGALRNTEEAG